MDSARSNLVHVEEINALYGRCKLEYDLLQDLQACNLVIRLCRLIELWGEESGHIPLRIIQHSFVSEDRFDQIELLEQVIDLCPSSFEEQKHDQLTVRGI